MISTCTESRRPPASTRRRTRSRIWPFRLERYRVYEDDHVHLAEFGVCLAVEKLEHLHGRGGVLDPVRNHVDERGRLLGSLQDLDDALG